MSAVGLEEILNCMYTQTLNIHAGNVIDVYKVAHYLQMDDIVKHCEEFMIKTVTDDTCLTYFKVNEVAIRYLSHTCICHKMIKCSIPTYY